MKEDFEIRTSFPSINSLIDDIEHKILSPLSYLKEFDNHWLLELDLPMVNKKDIKITFDGNMISVEAKLKEKYTEEKLGKISKFEYFRKSVSLPDMVDVKRTSAKFQKGRLEIKMPKKSAGRTVKIS
ncbi:MAG: Hsp20/alpha crystallin family protein [Nitrosopumilus sp.]|nr:MAG: Hsp20/alpha crystallin family protein [Nitrosopumilus sp.]